MLTKEEELQLRILNQSITYDLIPLDQQDSQQEGDFQWCVDWWSIEVLKCLFYSPQLYCGDPPPNRLRNNPLYKQQDIVIAANIKREMLRILRENVNFSDTLVVCEVGRGIDIAMALMAQSWSKIICYDKCQPMLDQVLLYFKNRLSLNVETICSKTEDLAAWSITSPIVMIANGVKFDEEVKNRLASDPKVLLVLNGRVENGTRAS